MLLSSWRRRRQSWCCFARRRRRSCAVPASSHVGESRRLGWRSSLAGGLPDHRALASRGEFGVAGATVIEVRSQGINAPNHCPDHWRRAVLRLVTKAWTRAQGWIRGLARWKGAGGVRTRTVRPRPGPCPGRDAVGTCGAPRTLVTSAALPPYPPPLLFGTCAVGVGPMILRGFGRG